MSLRTKNLKLVGAAGATLALTAAMSLPALAATHDLTYTCDAPVGPTAITFDPGTIKTTMVAGQKDKHAMGMVVHLDQTQTGTAQAVGDHVRGSATASGASGHLPFQIAFPNTAIPATPGATMDLSGTGTGTIRPLKAGTWTVKAGDMSATLIFSAGGTDTTTLPVNCVAPTDGSQNFGTITVSKDKTTTVTTASYSAAKKIATGKAKVKSHFGLKPTGKVKFSLKKGTHVLATLSDSVNSKGIALVHFKGVKAKGKYTIVGKYAGNSNLKGSSGSDTFTVG
jgi:hypothetical protein